MRILLSYTLVGRGGDALQVLALAEALETLVHEVALLGPVPLEPYKFSGRSGRLRSFLRRFPWWARDLIELGLQLRLLFKSRRVLRENRLDLVLHRAGIYDFAGAYLARKVRCPLIAHLDAPFPIERGFRGEGYFHFLHRACMRKLGERAKLIFTMSQASRDYYVQLGLPQEKIIILPNGVSSQLLEEGKELARQHPPLVATKETVIGFVGSLSRWHRVDLLLDALHLLNTEYPKRFHLCIVGYGGEYDQLRGKSFKA
jgi:glycosyltransferase involved in cell wall biosynthesis